MRAIPRTNGKGLEMAWKWIAGPLVVLALAGCEGDRAQNSADVRFMHASIDTEGLDVLVEDDAKTGISAGSTSSFVNFGSGTRTLKLRSQSNGTVLLEKSVSFASASGQTLVVYGRRTSLQTALLNDNTSSPDSGRFKLRVMGLSPDVGAVDVYLVSGAIDSVPANMSNVGYGTISDFAQVSEGNLRIVFATAGTKEVLFESDARSFSAGDRYSLAIFPSLGGRLVNALLLTEGNNGTGTYLANKRARLKAVNADPSSSGYNFAASGETLLSSVPYRAASSYVTTATGDRPLTIERANVPGTVAASVTARMNPAQDYSVIAASVAGQARLAVLTDDNTLPATGRAKVRFVNAFAHEANVDVLLNFAGVASNVAPRAASSYSEVTPGDSYVVSFTTPGGVSVITTLSPVELETGAIYTVYGFGSPGSAEARLVRDR